MFAAQLGIMSVKSNFVNVIPLGGRYIPATGDSVIGKVIDIGPSNWLIDINSPYPAPLHVNEVPWRVEFGDTSKYLNVGDTLAGELTFEPRHDAVDAPLASRRRGGGDEYVERLG